MDVGVHEVDVMDIIASIGKGAGLGHRRRQWSGPGRGGVVIVLVVLVVVRVEEGRNIVLDLPVAGASGRRGHPAEAVTEGVWRSRCHCAPASGNIETIARAWWR